MGTRIPRTVNDWKKDFSKITTKQDRGYKTECWVWGIKKSKESYGVTRLNGIPIAAHRASWIIHRGKIPSGKFILHRCDVRRCVNPDHLFLGTAKDNADDMIKKGRQKHPAGEDSASSVLCAGQVLAIRHLLEETRENYVSIGKKFKISCNAVRSIATGKTWTHLGPIDPISRQVRKLTSESIGRIKELYRRGASQLEISKEFGVNQSHICRILKKHREK